MDNILNSIKKLSENTELKENLINAFNEQVNLGVDKEEKWLNYRTFIENNDTLELFFDKFDYIFVVNEITINAIDGSNLSTDKISGKIFNNLDKYFLKKNLGGLDDDETEHSKDLLRDFGIVLKQSFFDGNYNSLETHQLYKGLANSMVILNIIFYIILGIIKNTEYEKIINLGEELNTFLDGIYQYFNLNIPKKEFKRHLLMISFLIVFLEEKNNTFSIKNVNINSIENHSLSEVFNLLLDIENKEYEKLFLILKEFNLLDSFLNKLEDNEWINDEYKEKCLFVLLSSENNFLRGTDIIILYSILFSKYKDVQEKYNEYIKGRNIDTNNILKKLKSNEAIIRKESINFLLLNDSKKYWTDELKYELVSILKEEIINDFNLESNIYKDLYIKFIDGELDIQNLGLNLIEFGNTLNEKNIEYLEGDETIYETIYSYLQNITKLLSKDDIKDFKNKYYEELVNKIDDIHLENYKKINHLFSEYKIEKKSLDDLSSKIKSTYLDNINILNIYITLLKNYNRKYSYPGLKENIKSKLEENITEDLKIILEKIIK